MNRNISKSDLDAAKEFLAQISKSDSDLFSYYLFEEDTSTLVPQVLFLLDVKEQLQLTAFQVRSINPLFLQSILEQVAFEENQWKVSACQKLLASALDRNLPFDFHFQFLHSLKLLSSGAFAVLRLLYAHSFQSHSEELEMLSQRFIKSQTTLNQNILDLAFDQLMQLKFIDALHEESETEETKLSFQLSKLGVAFLRIIL